MANMAFKKGAESVPGAGNEGYLTSSGVRAEARVVDLSMDPVKTPVETTPEETALVETVGEIGAGLPGDAIRVDLSD